MCYQAFQVTQWLRICLPMQESQKTRVRCLGREDPLEEEMATYSSLPGNFHRPRSLVGYNLEDHRESDVTEHAHTCICYQHHIRLLKSIFNHVIF